MIWSKIEKVSRGIQGNKSRKDTASSVKLVSTIGAWATPLKGGGGAAPGVRKGKHSLLASHTRCKCSMENTRNSVKVKPGIKVMKLVESLIGWEVTVTGQGSECYLIFIRGRLQIAEYDPHIYHKTSWMKFSNVPRGILVWVAYWKAAWPSE